MTDTTARGYPLPHPDNIAREDAQRIREAIQAISADIPDAASEAATGVVQLATDAEATAGASLVKVPAVKRVADMIALAISSLVGSAPTTLDTLQEVAAAIDANEDVVTALNSAVGTKMSKSANLSDLTDVSVARTNLGLAALALKATIDAASLIADGIITYAKLATAAVATAAQLLSNTASKLISVNALWAANDFVNLGNISGTVTLDLNAGTNFVGTLVGNVTLAVPVNAKGGQSFGLFLSQDATGGRTISFASAWLPIGGTVPIWTTAASKSNYLSAQNFNGSVIVYAGGKIN